MTDSLRQPNNSLPLVRVAALWGDLPAFRVVAETQHLPTAAEILGISPPALSKRIAKLESRLGQALFLRSGRRLTLNCFGESFLIEVRNAMRHVDDGITLLTTAHRRTRLKVAFDGDVSSVYGKAIVQTLADDTTVDNIVRTTPATMRDGLLRGDFDLAISREASLSRHLVATQIATCAFVVVCPKGQRSSLRRKSTAVQVVTTSRYGDLNPDEMFPNLSFSQVRIVVDNVDDAVALVLSGDVVGLLPEAPTGIFETISGLDVRERKMAPTQLYAHCRRALKPNSQVHRVVSRLQEFATK